jgi:biphenyl 2,3-dioxygenase beta subunit
VVGIRTRHASPRRSSPNGYLYRTRLNSEEASWIGSRRDVLRRVEGSFQIADRRIFLEQTVVLSRNLSNFF